MRKFVMRKYLAAALMSAIAVGPALALDVGGGGKVGGLGLGGGLSAGRQGVSVGVGGSVDGVGGANLGGSLGTQNGSPSVGVDAGGNLGNTSGGVSTGIGASPAAAGASASTATGSTAPGNTAPGNNAQDNTAAENAAPENAVVDNAALVSAKSAAKPIALPSTLRPLITNRGGGRVTEGYPLGPLTSLKAKPGTPPQVVSACRAAIVSAAKPLGAARVNVVSAGPMRQRQAGLAAPIYVRIEYARKVDFQVRQAKVTCRLDAAGRVTAVI